MNRLMLIIAAIAFAAALRATAQDAAPTEVTSKTNNVLKRALDRFPQADANGDGVLTMSEARAHQKKLAEADAVKRDDAGPPPTHADMRYGPHERNVLDFWKAPGDGPRPVVVFIHGGGFINGDKSKGHGSTIQQQCLAAGVSYAAINYRFRPATPIQEIMRDCARAIQFIRHNAAQWNVDKTRIASWGGSAGAGTSLWLAFHDDLADPDNADPVLRESSRLIAAGSSAGQATYDLMRWEQVLGPDPFRFHGDEDLATFYGLTSEDDLDSEEGRRIRADMDMLSLISRDDPPVYLITGNPDGEIKSKGHANHHPAHSQAVKKQCDAVGVEAVLALPGVTSEKVDAVESMAAFLLRHLKPRPTAAKP